MYSFDLDDATSNASGADAGTNATASNTTDCTSCKTAHASYSTEFNGTVG